MAASLTSILTGSWLTGPILGKELRMASRRRRHYVVRFLYLMVLVLMISLFWMQVGNYHTSAVSYLNQMSEIGRVMTLMIEWFQFVLCPIIAGVMLSTAISDEVYHKTLGVLMTTPITSLQVVMGKLLGKLLQMLLLMAMSLPLLAVIRVFGGIPWMFLISSFCLTLCLVLLAGSLSLWLSISQRRAYIVIIQGILCFVVAFGLVPFLAFLFGHRAIGERALVEFFLVTNPYFCMAGCTEQMIVPGAMGTAQAGHWLIQCGLLLVTTLLLMVWATVRVRRLALQQIAGGVVTSPKKAKRLGEKTSQASNEKLRTIKGWPLLWKDLRTPVLGCKRWKKIVTGIGGGLLLVVVYTKIAIDGGWDEQESHMVLGVIYALLGTLFSIIIPATLITREKESRSWPVLLGTIIPDRQILWSKGLAALRWCLPRWGLFWGHAALFCMMGFIHPVALLFLLMPMAGVLFLVIGNGLYWSARLKRTTTAVMANFSVPVVLWGVLPLVWAMLIEITRWDEEPLMIYFNAHPFIQIPCVIYSLGHGWGYHDIDFPVHDYSWSEAGAILALTNLIWMAIGLGFAWRAQVLMRKRVF